MQIDVLTLFPAVCEPYFAASIPGRAQQAGLVRVTCHDLRSFARNPHRSVDDRPFGGGAGMVLTCQPVFDAVESIEAEGGPARRILLTPQGERFDQRMAEALSREQRLLLIAGHYEGFDERIRLGLQPLEVSVGDYVLSGGEAAAMVLVDAVVRLIPGVLGAADALVEESFTSGLLEYPQYTRPREFRGMTVPDVLLSDDHAAIRKWRQEQAVLRTQQRRPDLRRRGDADADGQPAPD